MRINIKATGTELTPAIRDYVMGKIKSLQKFLPAEHDPLLTVEIGKTTQHHKEGELFRAELQVTYGEVSLRVQKIEHDLSAAIDVAKDELIDLITATGKKKTTLLKRGGRWIKDLTRGLSRKFRR